MSHSKRMHVSKLSLALVMALAAAPAFAQQTSAGVSGVVVHTDGRPVANEVVTITHTESNTTTRVMTDANGRYSAAGLRVGGPYTVATTGGSEAGIYLNVSDSNTVNITTADTSAPAVTSVGRVRVSGAGRQIFNTSKMGAGSNISRRTIEGMPSINRNIQDYVRLDPRIAQGDKARGELSVGGQHPKANAIRIDGVNTSDTFGLESNNFPTIRQPVSMDAIEAINVDISNYDTTITGATGAVIDAVTKSGTNQFHGSVYGVFRDASMVGDNVVSGAKFNGFNDERTFGATLGGPIIKDRLFFFANYEKYTRDSAAPSFGPIGSGATNIVNITDAQLAEVKQIAQSVYGVDIGSLEAPTSIKQEVEEKAIKLDWNINDNHRASVRFSQLDQVDPSLAGMGNSSLSFSSRWYDINKKVKTGVAQIFSDWTDNFRTEFKIGRRTYDSISGVSARLPQVSIGLGPTVNGGAASGPFINFGTDEFRHGNQVGTTTLNAYGAATWRLEDHTLKFGFDWDKNDIFNMYAQNIWGAYTFASIKDFRNGHYSDYRLNAPVPGNSLDSINMEYTHKNLGLFVQDSWRVSDNLTVLMGVRADKPTLDEVPVHNLLVQKLYGYDNRNSIKSALIQPRFGFNYKFNSERPTQLRGGVGLFQGAAANVWIGNSYQNTGFGLIGYNAFRSGIGAAGQDVREATWADLPANLDPDNPTKPSPASGYSMMVNLMDDDFKQPSTWKANLAFDTQLPWYGIIAQAELLVTKVNNSIKFERLDLGTASYTGGPDGRPLYWSNPYAATGTRKGSNVGVAAAADTIAGYANVTGWHGDGVILMKNTHKGGSAQFTAGLTKALTDTWGWSVNYTHTHATDVSPLTSSRAISNWNNRTSFDPNDDVEGTSSYTIRDRFLATLQFRKAFFGDYNTIFSAVYEGRSGLPHSWRYMNDMNGDGYTNDLMYVPAGRGDVLFTGGAAMETKFFDWLATQPELAAYAGQVSPRNGFRNPWVNNVDLRVTQELPGLFKGHKSEVWLDILNVGNLINKDWGHVVYQSPFSDMRAVNFRGVDQATGKYKYDFDPTRVWSPEISDLPSRWSLQVGFRYKF